MRHGADTLRTVCNRDCPDACGLIATVEDGKLVALGGDPDHPVTKGFLCYRTSQFPAIAERAGPRSRRRSSGGTARLVNRPRGTRRSDSSRSGSSRSATESGPAAILHYRSGGSLGLLKSVVDHFFELFGPVTVKRGDICSGAGDAAQETDFGEEESHDLFDLLNAKHVLLWGKNPTVSNVHLLPVLREAKRKGTQVILVDPVRHKAATLADRVVLAAPRRRLRPRDGRRRAALRDGRRRTRTRPSYCDHFDAFRALALSQRRRGLGPRGRRRRSEDVARDRRRARATGPARSRSAGAWAGG